MSRSIAILGAAACVFALACSRTPPPAGSEPTAAPAADASTYPMPEGPPPPMYKPSSFSKAPMPITDPAYGYSKTAPNAPGMGVTLPDFEVALADGGTFALAEARAAGPVLIMFYRGFW